jgi:DivIVA domain-containing protein
MEVSPKTLREVEFREKMRGYHPEDVDHFLEQVASGIEVLQDRLRQAVERAQRAEAAASEAGGADDTLRKTLILAQRTADLAVQEAREQAARILASAEQQAQTLLADADERGRRTLEDAVAETKSELARLETSRSQGQQDVDELQRWLEEHKAHLQASLSEAMAAVDRAGVLWPAPSTHSMDVLGAAPAPRSAPLPPPPDPVPEFDPGPETVMWTPSEEDRLAVAPVGYEPQASAAPARQEPTPDMLAAESEEQALDDFFDDNAEFDDEPRFGGRLRRRR